MEIAVTTRYNIGDRAKWNSKSGEETGTIKKIIVVIDEKAILTKYQVQEDKNKGFVLLSEITNV